MSGNESSVVLYYRGHLRRFLPNTNHPMVKSRTSIRHVTIRAPVLVIGDSSVGCSLILSKDSVYSLINNNGIERR